MEPEDRAGSHLQALAWAVAQTSGPILELGVGQHSTPYLAGTGRQFVSVETEPVWREWASQFGHRVVAEIPDDVGDWSVVLVDGAAETREPALRALRHVTQVFVCHDTEDEADHIYRWGAMLATFPHRRDFDQSPRTTLVSDSMRLEAS